MSENTKIEWADHTMNFWMGCTAVGPACDHCYAEDMMDRRYGRVKWGAGEDRVRTSPANWREPLKWDRKARETGRKATVFSLSLGDIWDNEVDPLWREQAFAIMRQTPNLIWLLLSKRIGNAVKMCNAADRLGLPPNCALGATMVNQDEWDRDMPKLREAGNRLGAMFTFASIEPMLAPIRMGGSLHPDWIIVGGESGPHARPTHPAWVRSIRDQCATLGVPFFFKQWGEWVPLQDDSGAWPTVGRTCSRLTVDGRNEPDGWPMQRVGKHHAGRTLDGQTHDAMPAR